ncbi:FMN-binding protein [Paenibacillus sp. FSL R7-0331]|uniref:FMN-binding protein n=1 Tax=Paenibacillus sp. FSL R7-0331 TaxID=1536773 RepID=UPI0004F71DF6|nr:FMN-binding protein [Paenibacillus sp. FSL R7-0331]AIQ51906.1 FMN-binding protein [Paenibacillus sp. FSL R7-0331]
MRKIVSRRSGNKKRTFVLVILGLIAVITLTGMLYDAAGRREIRQLSIGAIDFSKLQDGSYTGEYSGTLNHLRDAEVQVTVSAGRVSEIRILKGAVDKTGKPLELKEGLSIVDLFGTVLQRQSLLVDAISGATLTSKTHLKALEHALEQARIK